jgi:hypothetical protein
MIRFLSEYIKDIEKAEPRGGGRVGREREECGAVTRSHGRGTGLKQELVSRSVAEPVLNIPKFFDPGPGCGIFMTRDPG